MPGISFAISTKPIEKGWALFDAPLLTLVALFVSLAASASASAAARRPVERYDAFARRLLDPDRRLPETDHRLLGDRGRQRRQVSVLVRSVGGAEQGRRRRPARRRRQLLDLDRRRPARFRGARRQELGQERLPRHRLEVGRRLRAAQRQPEAHPHVGRSREARRRRRLPESVQLGRRALGRHGRVRLAAARGQDAEAGAGVPEAAVPAQRLAGHERPQRAQHVPVGEGRRAARLRERREARAVAGQARLLPDPEGDAADRDAARRGQRLEQGGGAEVRELAVHAGRTDDLGARTASARSLLSVLRSTRSSSRRGRSCSRSATSAAGTR